MRSLVKPVVGAEARDFLAEHAGFIVNSTAIVAWNLDVLVNHICRKHSVKIDDGPCYAVWYLEDNIDSGNKKGDAVISVPPDVLAMGNIEVDDVVAFGPDTLTASGIISRVAECMINGAHPYAYGWQPS